MEPGPIISRLRPLVGRSSATGLAAAGVALHAVDAALAASGGSSVWRLAGALGWLCWAAAARIALGPSARPGCKKRWAPGAGVGAAARAVGGGPSDTVDAAGPRVARSVGWGLVLAIVALGAVWRQSGLAPPAGETEARAAEAVRIWPAWASVLVFAIAPALGEELCFRGAVLRALARRHGAGLAWALSAVAFALVHPDRAAAATVLGAALAGLALASGRSREAIVAHALHNLVGLHALGLG